MVVHDDYHSPGGNRMREDVETGRAHSSMNTEANDGSRHMLAWRNMGPVLLDLQTFKDSLDPR